MFGAPQARRERSNEHRKPGRDSESSEIGIDAPHRYEMVMVVVVVVQKRGRVGLRPPDFELLEIDLLRTKGSITTWPPEFELLEIDLLRTKGLDYDLVAVMLDL